jgi:hypothetical protein
MQMCRVGFRQVLWTFDSITERKINENSDLVTIAGGMTKLLQPLDGVIS